MHTINAESETEKQIGFGKNRIESLSDCIFAFSMTLLVIGIEVPGNIPVISSALVMPAIQELLPDFIHYVIAFLLIAVLWVLHHMQFHKIRYADHNLLWITISSLLFVALIPFSTDLVGDYPTFPFCAFIFEINLLVTGALFYLQWSYAASHRDLLEPFTSDRTIKMVKLRAAVIPVLSGIGMMLAAASIPWSTLIYLAAPLGFLLIYLYGKQ